MTLTLSPRIEAKVTTAARRRGIEPSALIEQILDEQFPTTVEEAAPSSTAALPRSMNSCRRRSVSVPAAISG